MDLPDVSNWFFNYPDYANYVDQGLLREFPADWKERWPVAAEVYEKAGLGEQLEKQTGSTFCFPVAVYFNNKPTEKLPTHLQVYARKDWIEQVTGEPMKTHYTLSEVLDIARKLKAANPSGLENFYPITSYTNMFVQGFVFSGYEHTSNSSDFYVGADGQYHWGPADEATFNILKTLQDAWKEGLVHPEFYTLNQGEDEDMMTIAGTNAMFFAGGLASNYILFTNEMINAGLDPEVSLGSFFITDENGVYHSAEATNHFGALIFNPDLDDERFARVMDVINYHLSPEGQRLTHLGIEGTDFTVAEDGTITMLDEYTTADRYPSNRFFDTLGSRADDFSIVNPSYLLKAREKQVEQYVEKYSLLKDSFSEIDWNYLFHTSPAKNRVGYDYPTEFVGLITKEGDLRANWEAWVADKMIQVQPVIDELNAKIAK